MKFISGNDLELTSNVFESYSGIETAVQVATAFEWFLDGQLVSSNQTAVVQLPEERFYEVKLLVYGPWDDPLEFKERVVKRFPRLTLTSDWFFKAPVDLPISFFIDIVDETVGPYEWSFFPEVAGLTKRTWNDTKRLELICNFTIEAIHSLIITVKDANGVCVFKNIRVDATHAMPIVLPEVLPDIYNKVQFSHNIRVDTGTGTPLFRWNVFDMPAWMSTELPEGTPRTEGLAIDSCQQFHSTDNFNLVGTGKKGSYSFAVMVTDGLELVGYRRYKFNVGMAPNAPFMLIEEGQMPDAIYSAAYEFTIPLEAGTGVGPFTWTAEGMPAGLTLSPHSGTIAGTPLELGRFQPKITVMDSRQNMDIRHIRLFVVPNSEIPSPPPPAPLVYPEIVVPVDGIEIPYQQAFSYQFLLASGNPSDVTWQIHDPSYRTIRWITGSATGLLSGTAIFHGEFTLKVTARHIASGAVSVRFVQCHITP